MVPGTVNGMCNKATPCAAGLSCVGATATTMGTCKPAPSAVDAACDSTATTLPKCDQERGVACSTVTNRCVSITYASDGMPCGVMSDGLVVSCGRNGICDRAKGSATGTCKAAVAEGAACDTKAGPPCLPPANCITGASTVTSGICRIIDASTCK